MTILLTGGGSGGHITPVLAVADELKKKHPKVRLIFVIGKGDKLLQVVKDHPSIDEVHTIRAGKLRRYHGSGVRQLLDIPTQLKNIRDLVYVCVGVVQALRLIRKQRPHMILIKGGYVGVPVGLAAAFCKTPFITHDSDVVPGLANRTISRWAVAHAVAQPKKHYNYPPEVTFEVGVPVSNAFKPVSKLVWQKLRKDFGMQPADPVLCVTGGGLGASRLNIGMAKCAPAFFKKYPEGWILHITGAGKKQEANDVYSTGLSEAQMGRVKLLTYVNDLWRYSGVADLVITRAGANSLADFAMQAKPCIVVPNPQLTSGHQLRNAELLEKEGAVVVVQESAQPGFSSALQSEIFDLLSSHPKRTALASTLHARSAPHAARRLADLLVTFATKT